MNLDTTQAQELDFFRVLRELQAHAPGKPKIGESLRPAEDLVRILQRPSLSFAAASLEAWHPGQLGEMPRLEVNFFGLFGPNGALPLHLTKYAMDRERAGDQTLVAFINTFQHRMMSLFFKSWAVHQKTVDFDRPQEQRFRKYLGSLAGLGSAGLHNRDCIDDTAKLYFAGHLSANNRNPEGLAAILSDYFGIPTHIQSFVGRWLSLPESDACRLGESPISGILGRTVIVGSRVWECQTKFRLRMGPMRWRDLHQMLPSKESFKKLKTWVLNYIGEELEWDVVMVLKAAEVPKLRLGEAAFLGWTTWLTTRTPQTDSEDVIFNPA